MFLFLTRCLGALWLLGSLAARAQPAAPTKQTLYLSGRDKDRTVAWDFYCTGGRQSGYWTTIAVPSCWEQQGFGSYNYGRDYKTYGKNFRFADEQGRYRHEFRTPADWQQRRVFIVFEGSMTDTEVKVNGQLAGPIHQGAFYEFRYDITDKLRPAGQPNLLEVTVSKMSADKSVNNAERLADYWVFGGIFRPVKLEAVPQQFIPRLAIDARADGAFALNVFVRGLQQATEVQADILDADGRVVGTARGTAQPADTLVQVQTRVRQPRRWTSETPHLYRTRVTLRAGGQPLYQTEERFGFRTIEIRRGRGIFVNGTQVKLKGTNRHSWWPETGRTLSDAVHLQDVRLIKEMNMNAVRMSHYPPDRRFLELCDSLGLYVLDELAGWQKAYSTAAGAPLVREMVQRDCNHPSILFWSNGNEGGTNKELDDDFAQYDLSKRPVIHAHHRPGNQHNGIDTNHYENFYSTQKILADSLIYMPTEFLHCQDDGGGAAGLQDIWALHWQAPRSGGGFLWALVDEGVVRTDQRGIIDVNGVNAPDGVLGPHREKEGSFYAIREIFSPIQARIPGAPAKAAQKPSKRGQASAASAPSGAAATSSAPPLAELPADFKGIVEVENRYHFLNLSQCFFQWELVNFRKPGDAFSGHVTLQRGRAASPEVAPLAKGRLQLDLPKDWQRSDALQLAAFDAQKNLVYRWTWRTGPARRALDGIVTLAAGPVETTDTDSTLTLKAAGITVGWNRHTGRLTGLKGNNGDKLSFGGGPLLVSGAAAFEGLTHHAEPDGEVVEARYRGDLRAVRWKMYGSGWLQLDYEYATEGDLPFAGLSFRYPENYVLGARWLGRGPYRVWKNRPHGVALDTWENAYNNTQTGAAPWIYPEFKGYFADISWLELNTVEGKFLVATPDAGLYVRLFDFYGLSGVQPHPPLPAGNLSFLDAIPPLGTKLALNIDANTAALGPQSELNHLRGTRRRTLYFFFGLPPASSTPQPYTAPAKDDLF
ncbi:glycoside hydrolase family 2 [Hymenobacter sp. 15J16-1T3B]|uniref:glycoside hydrolase family 2 TIM barrel-domain containing protein n=1 Tax=Hymenobacter sp. 15J16-1T3B TaxID=2886941 RepID=UPI001D119841|nr:glycoside hydrolase family 2 TIM barrel-domain containing protein [Hymenobacter sp. 15J16-1T3B]MCC3160527.1 glycoside hydrolase family 2 [Hymenobacter sp. 15J16-1T3B]